MMEKIFYLAILTFGIVIMLSCKKECYICDANRVNAVNQNGVYHFGWEYYGQDEFCDGLPDSDRLPKTYQEYNDNPLAEHYTNCIPN